MCVFCNNNICNEGFGNRLFFTLTYYCFNVLIKVFKTGLGFSFCLLSISLIHIFVYLYLSKFNLKNSTDYYVRSDK